MTIIPKIPKLNSKIEIVEVKINNRLSRIKVPFPFWRKHAHLFHRSANSDGRLNSLKYKLKKIISRNKRESFLHA